MKARKPAAAKEDRKAKRRGWLHTGKNRLCMACADKIVPRAQWGSWTWGFGDCRQCAHFGITVEKEDVDGQAAAFARAEDQTEIVFDTE